MIISEKQQAANRQNAQHSTGPTTPEGRAAVRLNALTYGLRARSTLIPGEDPEEYQQLWDALVAEWQPQTCTERVYLEQMSTSQWLLARFAIGESQIYQATMPAEAKFALLAHASKYRTSLERSFTSALRELQQLQKERKAKTQSKQPAKRTAQAAQPPATPPGYVISEGAGDHTGFGAPAATDTR
jgi:hypothetical protein